MANSCRPSFKQFTLLIILIFLWPINSFSAIDQPAVMTINETRAGQLLFRTDSPLLFEPSLGLSTHVGFQISGLIAHVSVVQAFQNDSIDYVEGVYVFPLPDDAAVNKLTMTIGERVIHGFIKEKHEAREIYAKAKKAGKKATLLEQQRPNMFTSSISNIGPGETVVVELHYVQHVSFKDSEFSLRFPLTITPRYIPGSPVASEFEISTDLAWGVPTDLVPDAHKVTPYLDPRKSPGNLITIQGDINMGVKLRKIVSAYHPVEINTQGTSYHFRLKHESPMQQDFVLSWTADVGSQPQVAVFSEEVDGEQYALLMMLPPDKSASVRTLPKEMIFIIDTSGSMGGVSITQARESLLMALDQLNPGDMFNIIEFNSTTMPLHRSSVYATSSTLLRAKSYVTSLTASGGTQMYPALDYAFTSTDSAEDSQHVRQIVFITDGAVSNEQQLFELIHKRLVNSRLFTVGIGSAPNSYFMRRAAEFGRGTYTHIGSVTEVRAKMSNLFRKLSSPMASNIKISWPKNNQVEAYPKRIPDLYSGEPLMLSARVKDLKGNITVQGDMPGEKWNLTLSLKEVGKHKGVATVWARKKIEDLLDAKTTGADKSETRRKVIEVALTHQLVSPYTSFVAVEKTVSRSSNQPAKSKAIPNSKPKGQSAQQFAYPKTATSASLNMCLSLVFFALAVMLHYSRRFCTKPAGGVR